MTDSAPQEHFNDEPFRPIRQVMSPSAQKLDAHLAQAITDLSPPKGRPLMTAPSPTGFVPGEISSIFKDLRARREAMVLSIKTNGAEVAAIIAVGEQMDSALKAEGDALKSELGQLTNFPPA